MASVTHYEVYVLEGRTWSLQGRFVSADRERAVEEAKSLEAHLQLPTKVVREQYNTSNGMSAETVVYVSYRAKAAQRAAQDAARTAGGVGRPGPQGLRPNAKMPKGLEQFSDYTYEDPRIKSSTAKNFGDFTARLIFVVLSATVLAAMGTALLPMGLNLLDFMGFRIAMSGMQDVLFLTFLALFSIMAFIIGRRTLPAAWSHQKAIQTRPPVQAKVRSVQSAKSVTTEKPGEPKKDEKDEEIPPEQDPKSKEFDPVALLEEAMDGVDPIAERKREREEAEARRKDSEARAKAEADAEKKRQQELERRNAEDKARAEAAMNKQDVAREGLMGFLGGTVATLKSVRPQLDVFDRFGINLYLAGACEAIVKETQTGEDFYTELLTETIEIMGAKPAVARMFREKLDEYMIEPRYQQMVQAGRDAMTVQIAKAGNPFQTLARVLDDWNAPQQDNMQTAGTVAIVFTDMVGYTDTNTRLGDSATREIMRTHNAIVRSALSRFDGREVKHTGDGIMAIFQVVSRSVEAMVDVQRAIAAHNREHPDKAFQVRVGINAGEPMMDEGDYYGIAVTIAARICDKAGPSDTLCSQVVRELSRGTTVGFEEKGVELLKGIAEPQQLFKILTGTASVGMTMTDAASHGDEPGAVSRAEELVSQANAAMEAAMSSLGEEGTTPNKPGPPAG